jgi:hypothetical protein
MLKTLPDCHPEELQARKEGLRILVDFQLNLQLGDVILSELRTRYERTR